MIDYERLTNSVMESLVESDWGRYDFDTIISNAVSCWDDTAILVKSSDFKMVFDELSYELLSYEGFDIHV